MQQFYGTDQDLKLHEKLFQVNWGLVLLLSAIAGIGVLALYSAANGSLQPWAIKQVVRYGIGLVAMLAVAVIDIRFWFRMAYPAYAAGLVLLIIVEAMGQIGMGAQRWINLGFIQLQPSELMKIAIVLALARFFHASTRDDIRRPLYLLIPMLIVFLPVGLVLLQPDLGTSLMMVMAGGAVFFLAGVPLWMFGVVIASGLAALPVVWHFMHAYQKQRVLTFMNPESDPLGSGYHIMQSKIALGSGGIEGKGFLKGTQSHLNFLPEKQTDFIFTLWAEEWGLIGGLFLLLLFGGVFIYGGFIAGSARNLFGRLLAYGLTVNFSLYVFVNIAMVMGLIPVVGAPLPMISYGGTAMLAVMAGFGLVISVYIHRHLKLPKSF